MPRRVTNAMIARRLLDLGHTPDRVTQADMESVYDDLRDEIGNPIKLYTHKTGTMATRLSEARQESIIQLMENLT